MRPDRDGLPGECAPRIRDARCISTRVHAAAALTSNTGTRMTDPATRVSGRDPETGQPRTIVIQDGRILDIIPGGDDDGLWLSLGLFDLQLNSFAATISMPAPDPQTVRDLVLRPSTTTACRALPRRFDHGIARCDRRGVAGHCAGAR